MTRSRLSAGMRSMLAIVPCVLLLAFATPTQAQVGLGGVSPELIRQRIQASGLTPDQIRARLREAGYPPNLLDAYMSGGPVSGSSLPITPDLTESLSVLSAPAVVPDGLEKYVPPPPPEQPDPDALFGLDVFHRPTSQFQPLLTGPVPGSYKLGPGDVLVLVLTGDVEAVHTLEVTREGFVVIPQVGQLFVNTLTLDQFRSVLRDRLGRVYSGIRGGADATTRFDLSVARVRTNQVSVIGEVARPGAYQLASVATVLNALYAAGGPTERGNFRRIEVRRQGKILATFDLYDYLLRGDTGNDIILEQGDVVFVPVHGTRAKIKGEVIRPGVYELKPARPSRT